MTDKPLPRLIALSLALALLAVGLVFVLRPDGASYAAFLHQGDVYAAATDRAAAVAAYEQASRLRPSDPEPYLRLADLYLEWGRTADVLHALAQAERLGVGDAERARLDRLWIEAYISNDDWLDVVERAHSLLSIAPEDVQARRALVRAYLELRAWEAARAECEALLAIDDGDSFAHERLGALLYGFDSAAVQHLYSAGTDLADDLIDALESPEAAQDPAYASALAGRVLFEAEEWALAVRQFERALALSPGYPEALAYLGYALDEMGYPEEAYPHLLQAATLDPESVVARLFLGLYYERLEDYAAARTEYEAAYDIDPENPAVCVAIGRTWIVEGRYEVAEIWLVQAVSLRPDAPVFLEILARFYLEHNIISEGRGMATTEQLLDLFPDDARIHDLHGWAALQVGEYDAAHESLVQALSLDPGLATAHYHLGLLWQVRGEEQKAQEAFTRAIDLDTTGKIAPQVERATGSAPWAGK